MSDTAPTESLKSLLRLIVSEIEDGDKVEFEELALNQELIREKVIDSVVAKYQSDQHMSSADQQLIWMATSVKLIFENVILLVRLMQLEGASDAKKVADEALSRFLGLAPKG